MDKARLDAIRARCEAATPGPWEAVNKSVRLTGVVCEFSWGNEAPNGYNGGICNCLGASYGAKKNDLVNEQARGNAAFIAAARTDVPDLLAEVERLNEELTLERAYAEYWKDAAEKAKKLTEKVVEAAKTWRRKAEAAERDLNALLQLEKLCPIQCKWCKWDDCCDGDKAPEWRGLEEEKSGTT